MMCLALPIFMVSCGDDDEANTHTDASELVSGTFTGVMENADGAAVATDVEVVISKHDAENTQAVDMTFTATSINMNQSGIFNVAKAGDDRYSFGSGSIATTAGSAIKNCGGVLEGSELTFYLQLNSTYKFSSATAAKRYTLKLVKQ